MDVKEEDIHKHNANLKKYVQNKIVELILNADEIGLQWYCDSRIQCVIMPKEFEHEEIHFPVDRSEPRMSNIIDVALSGRYLRPFLISKEEMSEQELLKNHIVQNQNVQVITSTSCMMNSNLMLVWVRDTVVPYVNNVRKEKKLSTRAEAVLIVDNASSHCNKLVKDLLKANHIILLTMPPHSNHFLQPCDVGVFGALKLAYQQGHQGISIMTPEQIVSHIVDSTQKAVSLLTVANSFHACCIGTKVVKGQLVADIKQDVFDEILKKIRADNASSPLKTVQTGKPKRTSKFGAQNI
ncbi:MAG: hypothetical protein EZS28_032108 [Streblomastix strix]|uniref:DDE-1 domain-containing protein n=1 Tax=Streblomastix strix TaxID=222440 RepID=A0A5J4UPY2_9EUKA|nr:MAG: hypothetical protein EZS28_032108 [Streblomastix strix]